MLIDKPDIALLQQYVNLCQQIDKKFSNQKAIAIKNLTMREIGILTYFMSPQKKANIYEHIACRFFNGKKVSASQNCGDFTCVLNGQQIYGN